MDILEGLNSEQSAAVRHTDGPMLVVAGAGTGKTQVITRRIAFLISQGKAKPGQILALTFTEKAAREMEDRLYSLIGWESFQVLVMTFNAFGANLLGRYSTHIGRSIRGGLINSTQKALLIKQHMSEIDLKYYGPQAKIYDFVEGIVSYIEKLQNASINPDDYDKYVVSLVSNPGQTHPSDILEQQDLASLYRLYDNIKQETGTYDYYDQLALPLRILCDRPNIAQRLTHEYRYVLVDEYQDTSPVQDDLLRAIVPRDGNIFAVGDDDQSIYSFRGADINNILSFTSHFADVKPSVLIRNYRSGQPILDAAYRLICHNDPERLEHKLNLDKHLVASDDDGSVEFKSFLTAADEQAEIVASIRKRLKSGENPNEIAVLSRSNNPLRSLAKILKSSFIPFSLSAEVDVFSQREVISLWYILQWIAGHADDDSISHVILGPFFNWDPGSYRPVVARIKHDLSSAEDAMRQLAHESHNSEVANVIELIDRWRLWANEQSISQLVYRLVFETGLSDRLRSEGVEQPRVLRVFEDFHRLLTHMQDYESVADNDSLFGYLENFPKPPRLQSGEILGDSEGVQLLTIHASKGLEFSTVYIMNCTQRSWAEQHGGGVAVPETLLGTSTMPPEHEQRRLMYVAATRAKKELIVSAASASSADNKVPLNPLVPELIADAAHVVLPVKSPQNGELVMHKLQRFYPLKDTYDADLLPFEDNDGWLQLGVGALQLYEECPYDFFLQHVLGISEPFGVSMAFGKVVHMVIQAYYGSILRDESPMLLELSAFLDESWRDTGYESKEQSNKDRLRAQKVFEWFFMREEELRLHDPARRRIVGSEVKLIFELPEAKLRLRGRIDAYFATPEGIEIRDFKTGRGKTDVGKLEESVKKNFQLRTYALAYKVLNNITPARVCLDYVVTKAEGSAQLSERVLVNHRDKLAQLVDRIRQRDFAPSPPSLFHQCAATKFYGDSEDEFSISQIGSENAVAKGLEP